MKIERIRAIRKRYQLRKDGRALLRVVGLKEKRNFYLCSLGFFSIFQYGYSANKIMGRLWIIRDSVESVGLLGKGCAVTKLKGDPSVLKWLSALVSQQQPEKVSFMSLSHFGCRDNQDGFHLIRLQFLPGWRPSLRNSQVYLFIISLCVHSSRRAQVDKHKLASRR